jgi:hypothetical protein
VLTVENVADFSTTDCNILGKYYPSAIVFFLNISNSPYNRADNPELQKPEALTRKQDAARTSAPPL